MCVHTRARVIALTPARKHFHPLRRMTNQRLALFLRSAGVTPPVNVFYGGHGAPSSVALRRGTAVFRARGSWPKLPESDLFVAEGSQDPGGAARSHVQFALEQTDKEPPKLESRTGTDYWKTRPGPNREHSHFVLSGPIFCIDIHEKNLPVHIYIYMYVYITYTST